MCALTSIGFFRRQCYTLDNLLVVLITYLLWARSAVSVQPPGETSPDIEMGIGASANITCRITDGNISTVWFSEEETEKRFVQPSQDIIIRDAHTAILTIRNASEHMGRYQCMTGENAIGITKVYVGRPPSIVTDFSCKGYDFDYMICSFTKPSNMIYTKYELKLKANLDNYSDNCMLQNTNDAIYICNITISSNPILISREIYNFNLTGSNPLGTLSQLFTINNYQSVVPSRLNVEIEDITPDSVWLTWRVRKYPFYSTYGLEYRISLEPKGFSRYSVANTEHCISGNCTIIIENLKYAFFEYTLNIRAKVKTALDTEAMWSEPFIGTFRTQPRRPDRPPKIAVGSFHIDLMETEMRLYWQQLEKSEENGAGFFYAIRELDLAGNIINTKVTNESSVTFAWQRSKRSIYEIRAGNSMGLSTNSSQMFVYPLRGEQYAPQTIATVYHNRTYTLSWKPPLNQTELANYTVFWCLSKMESPNQCRGNIHFEYLDRRTTHFTTKPQDHTLNLALSANFVNGFTGMQWARCSADISSDLMKLEPEAKTISATTITVYWSSESVCPSILQGYNLSYCQVPNRNSSVTFLDCLNSKKSLLLLRSQINIKEYTIEHLMPYSQYRIEIFMYSKTKVGPTSDPIYAHTLEAAPSPPRDLRVNITSITSNSAIIYWLPPLETNGVLKYYTIWKIIKGPTEQKDSLKIFINETNKVAETPQTVFFKLESLKSFSNYKVSVMAHTAYGSEPSNSVSFKTLIGRPTSPRKVTITDSGDYGILKWDSPEMPSGRVEYYEVTMVSKRKNKETRTQDEHEKTVLVKENFCKFKFPACMDYYLKVRAVNVAERNEIDHDTFPSTKGRSNIKRRRSRHTNPEISTRIGGRIQTYDTTALSNMSVINQRFYERSNMVKTIITETTPKTEYDSLAESDFYCKDAERVSEKFANAKKEFIMLPSTWEKTPYMYMRCSEYPLGNVVKIALFMILLAGVLATASYWLRKRYNEMKNIDAVLPQELVDHSPNYGEINYNSNEKKSNPDVASRSNGCLVSEKESYYHFPTISSRSAKKECTLPLAIVESPEDTKLDGQLFLSPTEGFIAAALNGGRLVSKPVDRGTMRNDISKPEKNANIPAQKLTSIQENYVIPSPGYTNHKKYMSPSQATESNSCEAAANYLHFSTNNGYVQQNLVFLPEQPVLDSNGYTTLDVIAPLSTEVTQKCRGIIDENLPRDIKAADVGDAQFSTSSLPIRASNNNNNNNNSANTVGNTVFGGYVTQRQLAEFGQLLH